MIFARFAVWRKTVTTLLLFATDACLGPRERKQEEEEEEVRRRVEQRKKRKKY